MARRRVCGRRWRATKGSPHLTSKYYRLGASFSSKCLGQRCEFGERLGRGGLEDLFHLACDFSGFVMSEHAEVAGEFVGDGLGLFACGLRKAAGRGLFGCAVEEVQPLMQRRGGGAATGRRAGLRMSSFAMSVVSVIMGRDLGE